MMKNLVIKNVQIKNVHLDYESDIIKLKINMNKITYYLRLYIKRFRKNKIIKKFIFMMF